jgi:import receptor subunit TOM70
MAQLLLQQGKVTEALVYFERAAELSRTEGEIVNALSYAEATRTQLEVCSVPAFEGRIGRSGIKANVCVGNRSPRSTRSWRIT